MINSNLHQEVLHMLLLIKNKMLIKINSKLKRSKVNKNMNSKNIILICITFLLVVTFSFFISGADVCCEKTNSGAWCQLTDGSECAPSPFSQASTSCDEATYCQKGACVNENSGTCTSNTPRGPCEAQGGVWYNKDKDEIPACKTGCCILGQEVAFVNPTTCQQLATDYSVDVNFRADINSQAQCFSLDATIDEGACIFTESATTTSGGGFFSNFFGGETQETTSQMSNCKRTTQSGCSSLGGVFNKGLLCSAQGLSDCAKSRETKIENDKVYFKDTCGNLANVYDENRYNDASYWNEIQEPTCSVGGVASSSCGDCSYRLGTIGAKYDKSQSGKGMPSQAPSYGDNVCRELSCYYDTNNDGQITKTSEKYLHGESWCAESEGTYFHVPFKMDDATKNKLREGYNNYNLPGSRYSKLKCYDGEVIVEPCKEFRNEICKETIHPETQKRVSACFINEATSCLQYNTKTSCEDMHSDLTDGCKWVPGYNLNGTIVGDGALEGTKLGEYNEKQGTCYPIFAPGMDFWSSEADASCIKMNGIVEKALFETGVGETRENFADNNVKEAANKCIDGCYAIPGYGSSDGINYFDVETLKKAQLDVKDAKLPGKIQDNYLSKREGYYCKKKPGEPDTIDNTKTGAEKGDTINCKDNDEKDLERRRVKPFYTHEQWLKTIRERTRSIGDCGYKPHAYLGITGWQGDPDSEIVTVIFEKLKQDKEVRKTIGEKKILYKGDETTPNPEYRGGK